MAEIQAIVDYSPLFSSAVKVIWVSSDDKTGESKVGAVSIEY